MPNFDEMKSLFLTIAILLLLPNSAQEQLTVTLKAGEQITVTNKSIRLYQTTIEEVLKAFEFEDKFEVYFAIWDGVDMETGMDISGTEFGKNIMYRGIEFEYKGVSKDSLNLEWIRIKKNDNLKVIINDHIMLGQTNPPIDVYFTKRTKNDYISDDSLTYNMYSQGVSFQFERQGNNRILEEVSIHYKIEEN